MQAANPSSSSSSITSMDLSKYQDRPSRSSDDQDNTGSPTQCLAQAITGTKIAGTCMDESTAAEATGMWQQHCNYGAAGPTNTCGGKCTVSVGLPGKRAATHFSRLTGGVRGFGRSSSAVLGLRRQPGRSSQLGRPITTQQGELTKYLLDDWT